MSTMALQSIYGSKMGILSMHHNISASWTMSLNPNTSSIGKKELSTELQLSRSESETTYTTSLHFDRLQLPAEVLDHKNRLEHGQFVAREALLDEEYWTAAWLRAESHWEDQENDRYIDNYKRNYAEQEFNALKRRSKAQIGQRCTCIVAVRNEEKNIKRTVLKSVVGTLDLIIGQLSHGETYPGERVNVPVFCNNMERRSSSNRYGYIANLCVAKCARRQGIARNMLQFAVRSAKENGAEEVFVHVHAYNEPARNLYLSVGFEVLEVANRNLSEEQPHLLCLKA